MLDPDDEDFFITLGLLVRVHVQEGDYEAAKQRADEANARLETMTAAGYRLIYAYMGVSEGYATLAEREPSDENIVCAREACNRFARFGNIFPIAKSSSLALKGWFYHLEDKPEKMQRTMENAIEVAKANGMPFEQGYAHYHLGRFLPANHPDRMIHLEKAADIFENVGANWHFEQTQKEIDQ